MNERINNWRQDLKAGCYLTIIGKTFINRRTGEEIRIEKWNRSNYTVLVTDGNRKTIVTASSLVTSYSIANN